MPMRWRRQAFRSRGAFYDGGIHGFMTMPMLDIAHDARRQACNELARLLDT